MNLAISVTSDANPDNIATAKAIRAINTKATRLIMLYEQFVCPSILKPDRYRINNFDTSLFGRAWNAARSEQEARLGDIYVRDVELGHAMDGADTRAMLLRYADCMRGSGANIATYGQFKQSTEPQLDYVWGESGKMSVLEADKAAACVTAYDTHIIVEYYFKHISQPDSMIPSPNHIGVSRQREVVRANITRVSKFACKRPIIVLSNPWYCLPTGSPQTMGLSTNDITLLLGECNAAGVNVGWWMHVGGKQTADSLASCRKDFEWVLSLSTKAGFQ